MMRGKPFRGARLYRTHPLARGLIACWLFNEGTGDRIQDVTLNGREGVLQSMDPNTDWVGAGGEGARHGWALDMAGGTSAEYVLVSSNLGLTGYPFTMEAWVHCDQTGDGILILADSSVANVWYGIEILATTGLATAVSRNTSNARATSTTDIFNALHHLVAVFRGDADRSIYVDSVREGDNTTSMTFNTSVNVFGIGRYVDSTPGLELDGRFMKVSVWDRALEDEEIAQLYTDPYGMFYAPTVSPAAAAAGSNLLVNPPNMAGNMDRLSGGML